jgi:hypothetical protein
MYIDLFILKENKIFYHITFMLIFHIYYYLIIYIKQLDHFYFNYELSIFVYQNVKYNL